RARGGAVESRGGGERDEADRRADGGRDGDVHDPDAGGNSGHLLLVAAATGRRVTKEQRPTPAVSQGPQELEYGFLIALGQPFKAVGHDGRFAPMAHDGVA